MVSEGQAKQKPCECMVHNNDLERLAVTFSLTVPPANAVSNPVWCTLCAAFGQDRIPPLWQLMHTRYLGGSAAPISAL